MSALTAEMRKRFRSPKEALKALGLDENLLSQENNQMAKPTRFANLAMMLASAAVAPVLAKDAKVDLMPVFKDVTAKSWDAKKTTMAMDQAIKGKLKKGIAHDATMKQVADLMNHIPGEDTLDESVSEPQHKAMEAAAHGKSTIGIPEKVGKEFADKDDAKDEIFKKKAMDWMSSKGMDTAEFEKHMGGDEEMDDEAEDEENEEAEEENEGEKDPPKGKVGKDKKFGKDKFGKDGRGGKDKGMGKDEQIVLTKQAFDEALTARDKSTKEAVRTEMRQEARDMRNAEALCKQKVGTFDALAFDSAEGMKRHALKTLGCSEYETIHATALDSLLKAYPNTGAKPPERLAADGNPRQRLGSGGPSSAVKLAQEMTPDLKFFKIGA